MADENTKETTTPSTTPPVEKQTPSEQTDDSAEKPVETPEVEAEEEVKMVPLTELQKERERRRELEAQLEEPPPAPEVPDYGNEMPQLEPDAEKAVRISARQEAAQEYEMRDATKFASQYAEDLKNPFVAARVKDLIAEGNVKRQYVSREKALEQAKKEFAERVNPQTKEARAEGFKEGEEIAKKKDQLGAIGESRVKEKIDPDKLSAKEFAEFHGLEYSE